ncbi:MAG: 2Fe-2S iron-sulfur cluster-binding protein, partial [Marinobacter sp.]
MGIVQRVVRLQPSGIDYLTGQGTDLLTAAYKAGVAVPSACRNGVCELCEARLVAGAAVNTRNQQTIRAGDRLMLCRSEAITDLELEITAVMAAGQNPPRKFQAKVAHVRSISHDIYRVELQLNRRRELSFHAGQYLSVNLPGAEPCYFSIASSPRAQAVELHIQATPEWISAQKVIDALMAGKSYIEHIPAQTVKDMISSGRFEATTDFDRLKEPDCILICVPTPLTKMHEPDMTYVESTAEAISQRLRKGQLVVLESTTYPGTTREIMLPILEESGLKVGEDFYLA